MVSKVYRLLSRADSLAAKFEQVNETRYIDEAIILDREALEICTVGRPRRADCLIQLSCHLTSRYNQLGEIENMNEAIEVDREVLILRPPRHRDRSIALLNLSVSLWGRYNQLGRVEDLREAIVLDREALGLCPRGHPERSKTLNNLAFDLWTRFQQIGGVEDLSEAIGLTREALTFCLTGHPDHPLIVINLALYLGNRHKQLSSIQDLTEAIALNREALTLSLTSYLRSFCLSNLADNLFAHYKHLGQVEDLQEAIFIHREALVLCPPGYLFRPSLLHNFADNLFARYKLFGKLVELDEAIRLDREALLLRPQGHTDRSITLENLANHLCARYRQSGRVEDRDEMFSVYEELAHGTETATSSDVLAARAWVNMAEEFHHPTTLLAYETALKMLVRYLVVLPSLPRHLVLLRKIASTLAIDAFSAYIRNQIPSRAIESLEQGRGVFWGQLTRLRSPLDDITRVGQGGVKLADEYMRLTSAIRNVYNSPGSHQHDRACRLNVELDRVVTDIRKLPGLSHFLLPLFFPDLRRAASDGPVIIMNASKYNCNALVVFVDRDPVRIPLSVTKEDIRELSTTLRGLIMLAKKEDVSKELRIFLRNLWDRVVSPISDLLSTTCLLRSRIWWCPTAEFSLLPLHAANPFRDGKKGMSDLFISSYTPTLSALIRARQSVASTSPLERKRFIAIGQASAIGTSKLLCVGAELANIRPQVEELAKFTCIEGEETTISRVTTELSKNEWVHLACHGLPNKKQPFESAFALRDGHLSVHQIIQCNLQNAEFAYLSACHTTVGDEESPDEVIHLAAAMQFAGFRSVIGTMWTVDDAQAEKITSVFYRRMRDASGRLDHTRAAYALWKTMKSVNVPLDQRILYVHLGA